MADYNATVAALRTKLETGFTSLPVRWPNDHREATLDVCPDGFVYCEIDVDSEAPVTIGSAGNRTHRDEGTMTLFVYVPVKTLPGAAEAHAQTLRNLFATGSVAGVEITRRRIGRGQTLEGGGSRFYAVPISIDFFADRTE